MAAKRQGIATTKADVMAWVETHLAQDARLREQVEVRPNELWFEQQPTALREVRGVLPAP